MKQEKMDQAIQRLKSFEPENDGYYLAFSGGKDSQCIYHLAKMAGVKFEAHYQVTSVDPPELVQFIRKNYPDVIWDYPRDADGKRITMWNLIPKMGTPPLRLSRYCCSTLKEPYGANRVTVTGVRWAESLKRKNLHGVVDISGKPKRTKKLADELNATYSTTDIGKIIMNEDNDENRRLVEFCYRTRKTLVNPIIDWTDEDVWDFLNNVVKVEHCRLYDEGFTRLGCIGCPMACKQRKKQFERYPKYKQNYLKAFERMLEERKRRGLETKLNWQSADDVMRWWINR